MTTEPTTTPAAAPPTLSGWAAADPKRSSYVLAGAAAAFLGLAVLFAVRAFDPKYDPAPAAADKADPAAKPDAKDGKKDGDRADSKWDRDSFQTGLAWAGLTALVLAGCAAWPWLRTPGSPPATAADARIWILAAGGAAGLLAALFGLALLYQWRDALSEWLDAGKRGSARWVLYALTFLVGGLGLMFAALQPARAEERSNSAVRRALYGYTTVMTALLAFIVLVGLNVAAYVNLPNILDTTEAHFYTLTDRSKEVLKGLNAPAKAYLIMPADGRVYADSRQLLRNCEDASPNFKAVVLSPSVDAKEIRALGERIKLPKAERGQPGIVLTAGADEGRHAFIPADDLVTDEVERDERPADQVVPRLPGGVEAADGTDVPGRGGGADGPLLHDRARGDRRGRRRPRPAGRPGAAGSEVREYLKERKFDVKALRFDGGEPPPPEGAKAVVVLGPTVPFAPDEVEVLRKYLKPAKGEPGKLIAFLPPSGGRDGTVQATGLEPLLAEFGVELPRKLLLRPQLADADSPYDAILFAPPAAEGSTHPLAGQLADAAFVSRNARPVEAKPAGAYQAQTLLATSGRVPVWLEPRFDAKPSAALAELTGRDAKAQTAREAKRFGRQNVAVGVLVAEGGPPLAAANPGKPRLAVFGTSAFLSDELLDAQGYNNKGEVLGLLGSTLDWLRERPSSIGIKPREYGTYTLDKLDKQDRGRIVWMPSGCSCSACSGWPSACGSAGGSDRRPLVPRPRIGAYAPPPVVRPSRHRPPPRTWPH